MKTRLCIAALFVVSATSALADPPVYRITVINPSAGDSSSFAYGINDQGQVVGGTYDSEIPSLVASRAFYWNNGNMTLIGGGISSSLAFDINNSGVACYQAVGVGVSRYNSLTDTVSDLDGGGALARGISGNGMVVGNFGPKDKSLPVFWAGASSTMSLINTQSGNPQGFVQGVNNAGQVIGRDDYTKNPNNAFSVTRDSWVWSNGTYVNLSRPDGDNSQAFAINNVGKAAGNVMSASGDSRMGVWDFSSGTSTFTYLTDVAHNFIPSAMNDSGTIVGNKAFQRFATNFTGNDAFIYTGGQTYLLGSLLDLTDPTSAGFTVLGALDINSSGQIVGLGMSGGVNVGFIATPVTPVPEPASLLALSGLVGLALRKRRSR